MSGKYTIGTFISIPYDLKETEPVKDYKEKRLYKFYLERNLDYYNNPAKAHRQLREIYMGPICEDYAKAHPESPFYVELLALFGLIDCGPGSIGWDEYYKKKFSSPGAVWSSTERKLREWTNIHEKDSDAITLLAAVILLSHGLGAKEEVNRYLYQALSSDDCHYANFIWVLTAYASNFRGYLSACEEQSLMYRKRDVGACTQDKKSVIPVGLSWILFLLSVAAVCYPLIDIGSRSIDWYAVWNFNYKNTIGIAAAGIMILCFITRLKNTCSQYMAFIVCIIWTAVYSMIDSLSVAHSLCQITGSPSDYNPFKAFSVLGGRTLILISAAVISGDIGKHVYLAKHSKRPKYYIEEPYRYIDFIFISICVSTVIGGAYLLASPAKLFGTSGGRDIPFILIYTIAAVLIRMHMAVSDKYLIHAWYIAGLILCLACIMIKLIYHLLYSYKLSDAVCAVSFCIAMQFFGKDGKNVEWIPNIFLIENFLIILDFAYTGHILVNGSIMAELSLTGRLPASLIFGVGLAIYITLREIIFSAALKKRADG